MTQRYKVKTKQTIDTINNLLDKGIKKISVLIRHSDRFFSKDSRREPFMGLTDEGKNFALEFGASIRSTPVPKLSSSFIGRCIETSYLIDKGYTKKHNQAIDSNCLNDMLSPFYVLDVQKAIPLIQKQGNELFLRNWFDNNMDESIMENPIIASNRLSQFMIQHIKDLEQNQISICVSHDWNIYLLKECKLNLKHEVAGNVGYLDGLIFFKEQGYYYITCSQTRPVLL